MKMQHFSTDYTCPRCGEVLHVEFELPQRHRLENTAGTCADAASAGI